VIPQPGARGNGPRASREPGDTLRPARLDCDPRGHALLAGGAVLRQHTARRPSDAPRGRKRPLKRICSAVSALPTPARTVRVVSASSSARRGAASANTRPRTCTNPPILLQSGAGPALTRGERATGATAGSRRRRCAGGWRRPASRLRRRSNRCENAEPRPLAVSRNQ